MRVWIDEAWRGQGLGQQLMKRMEAEARERGATWARVTTFDFQARGFYEKLGYQVTKRTDRSPAGNQLAFLGLEGNDHFLELCYSPDFKVERLVPKTRM